MKDVKAERIVPEKKFRPIKVEFVLTSKEELFDLWHRLNLSQTDIKEAYTHDAEHENRPPISNSEFYTLWNKMDDFVQEEMLS